ncbi:WD40 repeat domain-containing protein [Streptomyces sp. GLT-R25]
MRQEEQSSEPKLLNGWPPPDLPNPDLLRTLTENNGGTIAMASAPDGRWLAAIVSGKVEVWDVASGKLLAQLDTPNIVALDIFSDGSRIAIADGSVVRTWNPVSGELAIIDCGTNLDIRDIRVGPSGVWLAVAYDDGVRIIDINSSSVDALLRCNWTMCLAISPDGSWIVTGNADGDIQVWDTATRSIAHALPRRRGVVRSVAIAPNGNWCAAASGDGVQIWNTGSSEFSATLTQDLGATRGVVISADSTWLVITSNDRLARIFDTATGDLRTYLTGYQDFIGAAAVAPDGTWLATGGNSIRIWEHASQIEPQSAPSSPVSIQRVITAPTGNSLATIDANGQVELRMQSTGERTVRLSHSAMIENLEFSPDGTWLATVGEDGVHLWDISGVLLETLTHATDFRAVAISPDGTKILAGREGGGLYAWNRLGMLLHDIDTGERTMHTIAFTPDGTWFATGTNQDIKIWHFESDSLALTGQLAAYPAQDLSVTPDGAWLVSLIDSQVKMTEIDSGQIFTAFGATSGRPAISPNGEWLATLNEARILQVWSWMEGSLLTIMRTEGRILDYCWSPDGSILFACGDQGVYSLRFVQ